MLLIILVTMALLASIIAVGFLVIAAWDDWSSFRVTKKPQYLGDLCMSLGLLVVVSCFSVGVFIVLDGALYQYLYVQGV